MVVHRVVLNGGPMKVFREGISLVINFWWQIRRNRDVGPRDLNQLRHFLFDWFIQFEVPPSVSSATMKLEHLLRLYRIDIVDLDNSLEEVSEQLVVMYRECLQGDFSSVEIIQEANLRLARHLIRPNSSEVDDASQVFRQGICLLMENLWVRHVFIHHLCHSNPHLMLQELTDDILFWFTQTITAFFGLLRKDSQERLYSRPINHDVAATNGITKEVATKLMLMHKECLQDNFSSVDILREESLNQDKLGMSDRISVAPLAAAVPVVSEKIPVERQKEREQREKIRVERQKEREREQRDKIRVERQKERERERRWLEDKDAAMGKKSKITTDRDHDISEELDLGYASTNEQGTMVVYDERLFSHRKECLLDSCSINPV